MASWAEVLAELEAEADEFEASLAADRALAPPPEWQPPTMDSLPTAEDCARIETLLKRQEVLQNQLRARLADAPEFRHPHIVAPEPTPTLLDRSA